MEYDVAVRVREVITASPDGFTVSPHTGNVPVSGYMVAMPGHETRVTAWARLGGLAEALTDSVFSRPDVWVGGWMETPGRMLVEPSVNIKNLDDALLLARLWDQYSIWDVEAGEEIVVMPGDISRDAA